jgi:bacterioferritin (cytochrome b1)
MSRIREDANYDPRTDTYTYNKVQDITEHLESNLEEQVNGINGWTEERTMRKIGSITPMAFYKWYLKNKIADLSNVDKQAELVKFLESNPQFRTVDKLKHDTANQGNIIIK